MELNTELLEITKDNLAEAQFMASNFIDKVVQNRIFFNVLGAESVISYLEKFGVDVTRVSSIHSIKRVVEKVDIADVILNNIHIDVRVIFNENEIFIPKSHFTYGIVPDIYAVLKYDKSFQKINFIGFFEASAINLNYHNNDYYFMEYEKLRSPFEMLDFINDFKGSTDKKLSEAQILKGRELSIAVADHDVTDNEFNEYLGLLSKSFALRESVLEYDNFETLASKVAFALQTLKSKDDQIETINMDDFVNMKADESDIDETDKSSHNVLESPEDANGDSLLDDNVDGSDEIVGAAGMAASAGIVTSAMAGLAAQSASKEAIELAAVAGDVVSDVADSKSDLEKQDNTVSEISDVINADNVEIEGDIADSSVIINGDSQLSVEDDISDPFEQDLSEFPDLTLSDDEELIDSLPESDETENLLNDDDRTVLQADEISVADDQSKDANAFDKDMNFDVKNDIESEEENHDSGEVVVPDMLEDAEEQNVEADEFENDINSDVQNNIGSEVGNKDLNEVTDSELQSNPGDFEDLEFESFDDFITEEPSALCEGSEISASGELSSENTDESSEFTDTEKITSDSDYAPAIVEDDDFSSFDTGESFDIKDEDFSDIFDKEPDRDIDYGGESDIPTEGIENNTEKSDDSSDFDTSDDSGDKIEQSSDSLLADISSDSAGSSEEADNDKDLIMDTAFDDDLSDISLETFDIDDNLGDLADENLVIDEEVQNEQDRTVSEPEESGEVDSSDDFSDELDSVDDELIILDKDKKESLKDDIDNEIFSENLESFTNVISEELSGEKSSLTINTDNNKDSEDAHDFEELPTDIVEDTETKKSDEDYGLVNLSDLSGKSSTSAENEEISFANIEDFDFETISPFDAQNSEIEYFSEDSAAVLTEPNSVTENSFVISDKNHTPGEIFIDINRDPSKVDISLENEHLQELYNRDNSLGGESGLNNDVRVTGDKGKSIPLALGVGGIALVVLLASVIIFAVSKFMNPTQDENESLVMNNNTNAQNNDNNLGTDVPNVNPDSAGVVMHNNQAQGSGSSQQGAIPQANIPADQKQEVQKQNKPIPATSFLTVRKLSWEVPDYVSADAAFRQYFQSAGKSLKAGLSCDLLLATDYTYSDQIRLSILFSKDGAFQQARVLLSSGSSQVDNIVLQSVNQTLKVLKAPNSLGNDQSTTVILKIYL